MSMIPRKPVQPLTARRPSGTATTVSTTQRLPLTSRGGDRSQDKDNLGPSSTEGYSNVLSEQEQIELASWTDEVYYRGDNCPNKVPAPVEGGINFGFDDERGDYTITPRDHIMFRYEIISMLGKGSFGQVVRCLDHKTNTQVAVKIIRNKKRFHNQAQYEIKVLTHLRERDQEGKYGIIRMLDTFVFRNHVCLTYELLSMNLYEYMKLNGFHPMPLHVVKKIGASILISLAFMWRENIIHCDLKPENILLRQPNRTGVKVIDLGSACFENERLYSYIQSRFYRAPEVILGLPYSRRIDLWSYACVLCELAAGYPLFPGENEVEQLACIMETLDLPPAHLVQAGANSAKFFDIIDGVYVPKLVPNSRKKVRHPNTRSLAGFLNLPENDMFIDFVRLFLRWDPMERPPPEPAMRHPWICDAYVGVTPRMPTVPQTARPAASTARIAAVAPVVAQPSAATNQPMPPVTGGGGGSNATAVPTLPSIPGAKAPGTARKQQP